MPERQNTYHHESDGDYQPEIPVGWAGPPYFSSEIFVCCAHYSCRWLSVA
jgi:hypothetical protein